MTKFRWYHLVLGLNFLASISIILGAVILEQVPLDLDWVYPILLVSWIAGICLTFVALLVLSLLHLAKAVRHLANGEAAPLRQGMRAMKLGSIPYFLLNFLYFILLAIVLLMGTRGLVIMTPIPLLFGVVVGMTYLVMLGNSVYGVCYVFHLRNQSRITNGKAVLHIILHGIFVLDILDTIILLARHKEHNKPAA